ncbi:MAG: hypothetical protein Q8P44_05220 [Dehalococcoidia bacterium]|nr:hypothetical protein [Dehalococcoidia bacterium]
MKYEKELTSAIPGLTRNPGTPVLTGSFLDSGSEAGMAVIIHGLSVVFSGGARHAEPLL